MRSKRMQPIAKHADQKEQDAVRIFVEAQNFLASAETQLEQLYQYREEYNEKLVTGQRTGLTAQLMRDYQAFLFSLEKAIKQTKQDIEKKRMYCEQQKQIWLKCRSRSHALNSVVEKYKLEEFKAEERREQKEQDEHAQRIGQSNKS